MVDHPPDNQKEIIIRYENCDSKHNGFRIAGIGCIFVGLVFFVYFGFWLMMDFAPAALAMAVVASIPFFGGFLILGLAKGLDLLLDIKNILEKQHDNT